MCFITVVDWFFKSFVGPPWAYEPSVVASLFMKRLKQTNSRSYLNCQLGYSTRPIRRLEVRKGSEKGKSNDTNDFAAPDVLRCVDRLYISGTTLRKMKSYIRNVINQNMFIPVVKTGNPCLFLVLENLQNHLKTLTQIISEL